MLRVRKIEEIPEKYWVEYKGEHYPLYEVKVLIDDDTEETSLTFATDALADEILDQEIGEGKDSECRYIDNMIYAYVPDGLTIEEIKSYIEKIVD